MSNRNLNQSVFKSQECNHCAASSTAFLLPAKTDLNAYFVEAALSDFPTIPLFIILIILLWGLQNTRESTQLKTCLKYSK